MVGTINRGLQLSIGGIRDKLNRVHNKEIVVSLAAILVAIAHDSMVMEIVNANIDDDGAVSINLSSDDRERSRTFNISPRAGDTKLAATLREVIAPAHTIVGVPSFLDIGDSIIARTVEID